MRLIAVGISHHTAPVELREKLAVGADRVPELLTQLRTDQLGTEAVILSTCNRVELYAVPTGGTGLDELAGWLAERGGLRSRVAIPHMYRFAERDALEHLFRVTSSLDSLIVGEPQIIGQVREAYRLSVTHHSAGPILRRVMDRALSVAKRVRNETDIGKEAVSVGAAGVELARQVLGDLDQASALLIGAGAHGKLVARTMLNQRLGELIVANRTFERAVELARLLGASATHLDDIGRYLERVDVVMSSAGGGRALITAEMLAPIMRRRRYRPLVLIDLSVPRTIAADVNDIEGVYRFDVDDLTQVAETGIEKRRVAAQSAHRIVTEEVDGCWRLLVDHQAHERIGGVVRKAEALRRAELERALSSLPPLDPAQQAVLDAMTRAIVKKVLHIPLSKARALAAGGELERLDVLLAQLGEEGDDNGAP
jgi:glutamyl-tRNA reductase